MQNNSIDAETISQLIESALNRKWIINNLDDQLFGIYLLIEKYCEKICCFRSVLYKLKHNNLGFWTILFISTD